MKTRSRPKFILEWSVRQLGHSSISITMDIYCHWIPGQGRDGLEEALGGEKFVPNRVRNPHIIA